MNVTDFNFELPPELIAQDPLEDRAASRLLVLDKKTGEMEHRHFRDILQYLKKGDCLVINDTKVIPARLMGHKVGWLTLYAGIAGGADIILLPEIPYDINVVISALRERTRQGKRFSILAVAEGAISKEDAGLTKKELKEKKKSGLVYPSVAYELGAKITEMTGQEVRVTVPGHMQRGGEPSPYDRVLATRLGAEAAKLIQNKKYGYMVAVKNNEIAEVPLEEVAGRLKTVDPNCAMIQEAKMVGISFGDE